MMIVLIPALLVILTIVGAVAAGMEAASPEATGRRVALSIVSGLLTLVGLCLAFLVYMFWGLAGAFG